MINDTTAFKETAKRLSAAQLNLRQSAKEMRRAAKTLINARYGESVRRNGG